MRPSPSVPAFRPPIQSAGAAPPLLLADAVSIAGDTVHGSFFVTVPKHVTGTFKLHVEATTVGGHRLISTSDDVVIEDGTARRGRVWVWAVRCVCGCLLQYPCSAFPCVRRPRRGAHSQTTNLHPTLTFFGGLWGAVA